MTARIATLLVIAACGQTVPDRIEEDYTLWPDMGGARFDITGRAPGHGRSYRIVYVNPIAADPAQSFVAGYQEDSIIVKEIRANDDGQPGALDYVAIMRRVGPIDRAFTEDGGWLFTESATPGGSETQYDFCYARCHAAAPYNGAFYDYRPR